MTRTIGATTQAPPYAGAPVVRAPLPVTVVAGDPCTTALTPGQVRQMLGVEVRGRLGPEETPGPTCWWGNPVTARMIRVAFGTKDRWGVSAAYPSPAPGRGWVWRELEVGGFPAVAATRDPAWQCTVIVGLADDVAVEVSRVGWPEDSQDVCLAAERAAGLVVATLVKRARR
ncbi:hypothetical protein CFP71_28155 [Amycolatopsis thailandensis]|uniref:DUF3558 domain-containing protein n=1 Tax=Amycolatopsis thailandensis TaxID=589330 RepID=A0A229RUD9_9PSEU|nr:hypothetical protein CFP71_28155 [Amycolatopsis thailandensis]